MSQQQRYDVSPKWAVIFWLGVIGMVGGFGLAIASIV